LVPGNEEEWLRKADFAISSHYGKCFNLGRMNLSGLDKFFWLAGFLSGFALFCVLVVRGRWRTFPVFTGYIGFQLVLSATMYMIYRHGSHATYAKVYWAGSAVDFCLQLGLLFEIARNVLKPTGTWVREARVFIGVLTLAGLALALVLTFLARPQTPTPFAFWEFRGNLFTSLLTCELYLALLVTSNFLGLVWRNHTMGLGLGLSSWAFITVSVNISHLVGSYSYAKALDHIKVITYTLVLFYWIYTFWRDEPQRRELPPGMKKYLLAVHQSVRYDPAVAIGRKKSSR
jgi:hypothetical protein